MRNLGKSRTGTTLTFSKVMAWVAFDRGARTPKEFGLQGLLSEQYDVAAGRAAGGPRDTWRLTIQPDVSRR